MELTRDDAVVISTELLELSGKLDRSVADLMRSGCSDAQLNEYRRLAGRIMASLYLSILKPIFEEYPDLQPLERDGSEAPLDPEISERIVQLMSETSSVVEKIRATVLDKLGEHINDAVNEVRRTASDVRDFVDRARRG